MKIFEIGIDVSTGSLDAQGHMCHNNNKTLLINRLMKLVSTVAVSDGGRYTQDEYHSQVWVDTTKTEEELEHWMWKNNLSYVGVFER